MSLVFTTPIGCTINGSNFTIRYFRNFCKNAGFVGMRLHDLRHFFSPSMLSIGVSIMVFSEQLGHSSINITLD
ncbi:MAG: tyrosine-type recombinase/integrase [Schwartzia sp.]|nr:tyrosine-type recombinase/integrase [Schwartzia sp. (in: firmicutes)]